MLMPTKLLVGALVVVCASSLAGPATAKKNPPVDFNQGDDGGNAAVILHPIGGGSGPDPTGGSGGKPTASGGGTSSTCKRDGKKIPCKVDGASWSASHECYVRTADPQPPDASLVWDGHRDADGKPQGKIYECVGLTPGGAVTSQVYSFWAAANPAVGGGVDPAELAEEAVEKMRLRAIELGLTPPADSDSYTLIGIPTWMWVDDPGAHTWGPITESASAGGVTVTATAKAKRVRWSMGDGTTVNCGKGVRYQLAFDADPSPNCGHRYTAPGRYDVSATTDWEVDWSGAGQSGEITFSLDSDVAEIWVREAFALTQENG